jgi:hypothetical protein
LAFEEYCSYPSLVCNYTLKTFDKWSMGDNSQYFIEKKIWSNLNHSRIHFNDLIYYMYLLFFFYLNHWNSSDCDSTINQGRRYKEPKLNMQRPLWSKVKIKKTQWTRLKIPQGIMSVHYANIIIEIELRFATRTEERRIK